MKLKGTFTAPLLVVIVMFLTAASRFLDLSALAYNENICLAVIVVQLVTLAVPTVFYTRLRGQKFLARMRFRLFSPDKLLVTLLASLTLIFGDILLKLGLKSIGIIDGDYSVYGWFFKASGADADLIYSLMTFAVIPSVAEELLFRGVLPVEYESNGVVTAVIASSLLYAMFGMNFGYFPVYFLCGIFFSMLTYLTRSILAPMLCHLLYSVSWLIFGETIWKILDKPQSTAFLIFAVGGIFLVALSSLLSECERVYYQYALANRESDYAKACPVFSAGKFFEAVFAPPFPAAALVFAAAAIHFGA